MTDFNSLAEQVIGSFTESEDTELTTSDVGIDDQGPRTQERQAVVDRISNLYIKEYVSPHTQAGFRAGDFQIGSVILPIPPAGVRVNRIRDVHTIPVLRGASIPARMGEGVTTIDMTIDFPDYTTTDGSVNPLTALIAEFKVSPFTAIRNRDLSSKISQVNLHEPPAAIKDALANIRNFATSERIFRRQFDQFFVSTNDVGAPISADWQNNLKLMLGRIIADVSASPTSFEFTKSEELEGEYFEAMTSNEGRKPSDIFAELYGVFKQGARIQPGDATSSRTEFGEGQWDSWDDLWNSNVFEATTTKALRDMIQSARVQLEINKRARDNKDAAQAPRPPRFVPVVLTRMIFKTKPGSPRCARVDMSFELFNFRSYVDRFEWHHYNGTEWTTTEDASEADLLLRWRDQQFLPGNGRSRHGYLDMSKISLDEINSKKNTNMEGLSSGSTIPGYFKYLRAAWKNRRCKTPSHRASDHKLRLFYPESVPQIHNAAAQAHSGFYRELVADDGTTDTGITTQATVVWDIGIARQIDEFTGTVAHQAVGGSTLNVAFEVTIPVHETAIEGDSVKPHEELIGRVNRMFDTIEQNRRILPSEAFMPTSVFILNPITEMFGAYVFEAGDMPVTQFEPGCAKVTLKLSEAIPVVGLGQVLPQHLDATLSRESAMKIALGLSFYVRGLDASFGRGFGWVERDFMRGIIPAFGLRESLPEIELTEEPDKTFDQFKPPAVARRIFTYTREGEDAKIRPWSENVLEEHRKFWKGYANNQGSYYPIPTLKEEDFLGLMIDTCSRVTILRYLDPAFQQSGTTDAPWLTSRPDPISELINHLEDLEEETTGSRLEIIKDRLVNWNRVDKKSINKALSTFPRELIPGAETFLRQEGLFTGDLTAVLDGIDLLASDRREIGEQNPKTYMLYPDMILPTIREVLGVDPTVRDDTIPVKHLTHFVPSFAEYGKVIGNQARQHFPGRQLDDLADPDVWYARQVDAPTLQSESGESTTYDRDETTTTLNKGNSPTSRNGKVGTGFLGVDSARLKNLSDLGQMNTADYLASVDVEQLAKPNRKRMLFAFPTYALEFTLDGQKSRRLTQSAELPLHWEARFLNNLPVVKLQVNLDTNRPNVTEISFISRRAALRNESWHWLDPEIEIDEDVFTNIPSRIVEILNEDFPTRSDPNLLTKLIMAPGSRVSVRMGHGTDINNTEMLPVVVAGTIGEISLGEMSTMKIQDLGMQLLNPLEKTIGGTGNWSPNRIWSGKFTMRAFTDIFNGLDTRFMGRSGRGTEIDVIGLTDNEVSRIYEIGLQTRNTVEVAQANLVSDASTILHSIFHSPIVNVINPATLVGRLLTSSETYKTGTALLEDKTSRFFPEMLNVFPCVTGLSDWATSNTDAKGISGTYWIDMLARLNPGCVWWTHPFGNEARLFFGRPEQYYRKNPLPADGMKVSAFYQLHLSNSNQELNEQKLDPASLAKKIATTRTTFRGVVGPLEPAFWGHVPSDYADVFRAMVGFETVVNQPDLIDEFYRNIWIELIRSLVQEQTGRTPLDFLLGNTTTEENLLLSDLDVNIESDDPLEVNKQGTDDLGTLIYVFAYLNNIVDLAQKKYYYLNGNSHEAKAYFKDFRSRETFSRYLKRLSSVSGIDAEEEFPGEVHTQLSAILYGYLPKFAGLLIRALEDKQIGDELGRIHQITKALSVARHALGFRRFRQYHHVVSGKDLLTNRLVTSQAKMANAVQVDSYTVGYSVLPFERRVVSIEADVENLNFGMFQWFKGLLGPNDRDRVLGMLIPNALARGMARMYDGIIEIRGNPQIKPHDVVYILDLHNGIYGPVKCKTVIHCLDSVQGFVTRIVPELHTQAFSSRVLSEHVANQRILRNISVTTLIAGTGAALLGGPVGLVAGLGLAAGAAAISTYASLSDTIARRQLVNFSAAETLSRARTREETELVMKHMMLDTFVSSNKIKAISPTEAEEQNLITRMANANQPELGVSVFPLMRFGSYAPIVAGLKTDGLVPIDTSFTGVTSEAAKFVKGAIIDIFDVSQVLDYIGENVEDVQSGWRATMNAIERELETKRRAEAALKARGVEVR